jgi:hypothetical protein
MISLGEIQQLADALISAEKEVEKVEGELKIAKEHVVRLREESLPMAMQELGLDSIKLSTGQSVKVKQDVYAAIPAASKQEAYGWLNDHGFGGLIKTEVSVQFGKGEEEAAQELMELLRDNAGVSPVLSQSIHAQTLCAFLREQLADAETSKEFPLDLFGARPVWIAKVTQPK